MLMVQQEQLVTYTWTMGENQKVCRVICLVTADTTAGLLVWDVGAPNDTVVVTRLVRPTAHLQQYFSPVNQQQSLTSRNIQESLWRNTYSTENILTKWLEALSISISKEDSGKLL